MTRYWIDTDIALGTSSGDVDDGFALAAVLAAGVEVVGVSAVAGNTTADRAADAARALLRNFGREETPVVPSEAAAAALAALPEGTRVLALGPLTHLVAAAELDPDFSRRVSVWAVGSVLDRRRHPLLPWFCLNFRHDPKAGRRFMELPWRRRRICPLDVVSRLRLGKKDLDRLAAAGGPAGYLAAGSRRWLRQAPWRHFRRSFPVWDLVAALDALGQLPGARCESTSRPTPGDRLVAFDVAAAKAAVLGLLERYAWGIRRGLPNLSPGGFPRPAAGAGRGAVECGTGHQEA
ncbi:MAG: nucleoside hydrolase [Acidobacteriota bacterium]